MQHQALDDAARDRALEFVLRNMSAVESEHYARHLDLCPLCRAEVTECGRVLGELTQAAPESTPSPAVWQEIRRRIHVSAQPWKNWSAAPASVRESGLTFVPSDAGDWEETDVEGVSVRRLFVDRARDSVTMLVRMKPGSSYPRHRHNGPEECFVLQGDLRVGEALMRAGDYQRAEVGSLHAVQSTEDGCLLLIVSSLGDDLIE